MSSREPYGKISQPTLVDRFGVWLSARRIRSIVGNPSGRRFGDFGCGFHAPVGRLFLDGAESLVLVDMELSDELKVSTLEEMDDHKAYYDPRDLWPMLVEAGFKTRQITCFRHKFGLNTFAICRLAEDGEAAGG